MIEKADENAWRTRAAAAELLALGLRFPDERLAALVRNGEWANAAVEVSSLLSLSWEPEACPSTTTAETLHDLRVEATRLFVGTPKISVPPYEGVWMAREEGEEALLFVNPHAMGVERFCRYCGLGRPTGTNEPLDHVATELELLEYLADRAASGVDKGFPGGSAQQAYRTFLNEHVLTWMPRFAETVVHETVVPFYKTASTFLISFLAAEQKEFSAPSDVSPQTLSEMDKAMKNLNDGKVSNPVDLSDASKTRAIRADERS